MRAAFKTGDPVVVDAGHHQSHGRQGVVVSVDMTASWPVGVLLGQGLSSVVHHFREDELAMRGNSAPEHDGTEAESLAQVSAPKFPDVLVHGRAGAA